MHWVLTGCLHRVCKDCMLPHLRAQQVYIDRMLEEARARLIRKSDKKKDKEKEKDRDRAAMLLQAELDAIDGGAPKFVCPFCEHVLEDDQLGDLLQHMRETPADGTATATTAAVTADAANSTNQALQPPRPRSPPLRPSAS